LREYLIVTNCTLGIKTIRPTASDIITLGSRSNSFYNQGGLIMIKNNKIDNPSVKIEKATVVNNKGCSVCAIGAVCLADGPIPDFEIAGVSAVFTAFG
jgi:subtilosin-A